MHCHGLPQHALGGRNKRGVHLVSLYFRAATTKPIYAILREKGHLNVGYIEDLYLQGDMIREFH